MPPGVSFTQPTATLVGKPVRVLEPLGKRTEDAVMAALAIMPSAYRWKRNPQDVGLPSKSMWRPNQRALEIVPSRFRHFGHQASPVTRTVC